jgi:hypothetical protein
VAEVDVTGFVRVCSELSRLSGKDFAAVLMPQVAAVLKSCIRGTPTRNRGDIAKRISKQGGFIQFADGTTIATWKKAGHAEMFLDDSTFAQYANRWPKNSPKPNIDGGKSWHAMNDPNRHWSPERWAKFQTYEGMRVRLMKERYQAILAARGLAKKTWMQIADALGLDVQAAGYVRNARYRGREFVEGFATKIVQQSSYIIEMVNSNPLVCGKLDGNAIIARALAAREKAFDYDMTNGVFDDIKRRVQRYPGIFTS